MTEPREKGWVSMGLPEPGPVRGMRGVVGLLLVDDLVGAWVGCVTHVMLHRLEMKMMLLINSERETFSSVHHDVMIDHTAAASYLML
eukprot:scaffold5991_cov73-Cyclotella_meneghiniana.AAC.2